jgi:hypothetical protein
MFYKDLREFIALVQMPSLLVDRQVPRHDHTRPSTLTCRCGIAKKQSYVAILFTEVR